MHATSPHLDGQYTAYGTVSSGIEAVDKIVGAPRDGNDRPKQPAKIKKITIQES
jgi:peptidyl-prolyl cis-trans isomerase B (cyclophilin B)